MSLFYKSTARETRKSESCDSNGEVRHAALNSRDHSWGPARHTELAGSQVGSGTPHCTRRIAVGVQHATLNSQHRGWSPARHTELIRSRLIEEDDEGGEEDEEEKEEKRLT